MTDETERERASREADQAENHGIQFALAGIRALLIINGGAVVAILSLAPRLQSAALGALKWSVVEFAVGIVMAVLSYGAAYCSQRSLTWELSAFSLEAEDGNPRSDDPKPRFLRISSYHFMFLALVLAAVSLALFLWGAVEAAWVLFASPPPPPKWT